MIRSLSLTFNIPENCDIKLLPNLMEWLKPNHRFRSEKNAGPGEISGLGKFLSFRAGSFCATSDSIISYVSFWIKNLQCASARSLVNEYRFEKMYRLESSSHVCQ